MIFCILELENAQILEPDAIECWKNCLASIHPEACYNQYAKTPEEHLFNWVLFTAVSEYMRQYLGLCNSSEFIDIQISTQLRHLDENGMYMDADIHPPMVYDLVSRGLFCLLLHFGYHGTYAAQMDSCLKKAGLLTLQMQSVSGEIPYGGRSNQFLFNEALFAIVCEYEANRYEREGNLTLANCFKAAITRALRVTAAYLNQSPIRHIKNRFSVKTQYGCEEYAYFDKYMITTASYLYAAYLLCNDTVSDAEASNTSTAIFCSSSHFHKIFLKSGEYALEFDTDADPHYDASGLGRVHRKGAPSAICLSVPCPSTANYIIDLPNPPALSLCPGVLQDGVWQFATGADTKYELLSATQTENYASMQLSCRFSDGQCVTATYTVDQTGVKIEVCGDGTISFALPALCFDGETSPQIAQSENHLAVALDHWVCQYTTDGAIRDSGAVSCNRNGHYRAFFATANQKLNVHIEIFSDD
ncbi:MAG: hypothetical protein IJW92_05785 [Clostridia bacterium]|nr:hypothetical protein [Clostridia bacterium]